MSHQHAGHVAHLFVWLIGCTFQLILLPLELFRFFFRGYRYTGPRIVSWFASVAALAVAVMVGLYVASRPPSPAPIITPPTHSKSTRQSSLPSRKTDGFGDSLPSSGGGNPGFSMVFFVVPPIWMLAGFVFLTSTKSEQGASRIQSWNTRRFGFPFTRSKVRAVDVAASRGQTVLRGTAVQQVPANAQPKIDPAYVRIGGAVVDPRDECKHFLMAGRTGAGKSQAIYGVLSTVLYRRNPALIADPGGTYLSRFGYDGALVLNPFDARDAGWSPFAELEQEYDCDRLAKAAIPDADGEARQWHYYAQSLLAELLRAQWKRGNKSIGELLRLAFSANREELFELLLNSPAEAITSGNSDRMLGSTRAIIATYLAGWRYLSDDAARYGKPGFSIRQWARAAAAGKAPWLFCVYRDDQMALLRNVISCWLDVAVIELLSTSENPDRRVWFIADELDSLGKVGALRDGLTKLRKYGGSVVAGLQTIAQLRATYGRDEAQVLLSCLSTKLTLAAGDAETAQYFEKQLGQQEIERIQRSGGDSLGMHGPSNSNNWSRQQQVQSAVLASEITNLPDLQGFLQLAGGNIGRIALPYYNLKPRVAPFVPKTKGAKA